MRILCLDDEYLALQMLENCVQEVKPDADVDGFDCWRKPKNPAVMWHFWISICAE